MLSRRAMAAPMCPVPRSPTVGSAGASMRRIISALFEYFERHPEELTLRRRADYHASAEREHYAIARLVGRCLAARPEGHTWWRLARPALQRPAVLCCA